MTDNEHDNDGDTEDPNLDAFTRVMEGEVVDDNQETLVARAIEPAMVDQIQLALVAFMDKEIQPMEPYYLEVQMALATIFLDLGRTWLSECDYETFPLNRSAILQLIGLMSAHVNQLKPDARELVDADVSPVLQ